MYAFLILLSLVLLFRVFRKSGNCWRSSVLLAALSWGVLVTLMTEALSVFSLLTFSSLLILWTLTNLSLVFVYSRIGRRKAEATSNQTSKFSSFLIFLLGSVTAIVATVGLIALIAPPNNYDSMTYHMSRVAHWIQNHSVAHYPTPILRQLHSGPWAGFVVTHLQILSGGDRFANLVQWFSMAGSIIGVSLIAYRLGANLRGQVFSAVFCATIPMGILQGSSTQTDYVTSFWFVCFAYFVILATQDKMRWIHIPTVGASFGLVLLAKGVSYIYALPFCLWLLFAGIKYCRWNVWQPALATGAIAVLINLGHYYRNFELFGSVLGPAEGQGNKDFSLPMLISNIIRNLALHFSTPVRSLNLVTIRIVEFVHKFLGVDVSDPRITSPPGQNFDIHSLINHEDLAGNFVHLLLFITLAIYFFLNLENLKKRKQYILISYLLTIIAGFILFCLAVKWSPWRSRLHLSLFVLASPFVGIILADLIKPKLANAIALLMIALSPIWVFFNETRPLIFNSQIIQEGRIENIFVLSRTDQYFINQKKAKDYYTNAAQFLKDKACNNVGMILGSNTAEYPFWVLLSKNSAPSTRLEHLEIENESAKKRSSKINHDFNPCAIFVAKNEVAQEREIELDERVYIQNSSKDLKGIFLPKTVSVNLNH